MMNSIDPKIKVKRGVSLKRLKPEARLALSVARHVYENIAGFDVTVTSTNDGKHMKGSKHYIDQAFDTRIWYLSKLKIPTYLSKTKLLEMRQEAKRLLGENYDIVLEKTHLHWEYDPK